MPLDQLYHRPLLPAPLRTVTHIYRSPCPHLSPHRPIAIHSFSFFQLYQYSLPLTTQPPTPHPIAHRGTSNTALIGRFTSPDLPLTHLYKTTTAPAYMRHQTQHPYHKHIVCLRDPSPNCDLMQLNLNDEILNHTLKILHRHSPHSATRHFVPTFFLNMITQSTTNLHRFHQRQLETPCAPHLFTGHCLCAVSITSMGSQQSPMTPFPYPSISLQPNNTCDTTTRSLKYHLGLRPPSLTTCQ